MLLKRKVPAFWMTWVLAGILLVALGLSSQASAIQPGSPGTGDINGESG